MEMPLRPGVQAPKNTGRTQTVSEDLGNRLAELVESSGRNARFELAAAIGGTATIAVAELLSWSAKIDAVGGLAIIAAGINWLSRKQATQEVQSEIDRMPKYELLANLLPRISEEVDTNGVIEQLKSNDEHLKRSVKKVQDEAMINAIYDQRIVTVWLLGVMRITKYHRSQAGYLYWMVKELHKRSTCVGPDVQKDDASRRLHIMLCKLDELLPIDQQADTLVPANQITGEKTWAGYLELLNAGNVVNIEMLEQQYRLASA
ncbi:hypothetical protein KC878_03830 [Candidatus Saccharibacteria bacterium]|nr:hypothetical protein [Candidatus Saccharibacteria bacterium]MCB9821738.1 hypothetical protein [Candidatus Nomurabacteria bacterium]